MRIWRWNQYPQIEIFGEDPLCTPQLLQITKVQGFPHLYLKINLEDKVESRL